jgi:alpha-ketoglutarate-dependent taurine dioxygenase
MAITRLIITTNNRLAGDTLFASAYKVYDRISEHYQKFLETLTATFSPVGYSLDPKHEHLYQVARGSPLNVDQSLTASHPVVCTNPVTG